MKCYALGKIATKVHLWSKIRHCDKGTFMVKIRHCDLFKKASYRGIQSSLQYPHWCLNYTQITFGVFKKLQALFLLCTSPFLCSKMETQIFPLFILLLDTCSILKMGSSCSFFSCVYIYCCFVLYDFWQFRGKPCPQILYELRYF